jgi:uncharacterized protein
MQDGMFVLDCVVHVLDYRHEMTVHPDGDVVRDQIVGFNAVTARKGPPENPDIAAGPPDFDWCNDMLFGRSNTDVAMVQAVPLFGLYREGVGPFDLALEYYESNKDRLMLCGGVDPLFQGIKGAREEMRRQVELGAKSIKFYQAQSPRDAWKADDRSLAYPLFETAQESLRRPRNWGSRWSSFTRASRSAASEWRIWRPTTSRPRRSTSRI